MPFLGISVHSNVCHTILLLQRLTKSRHELNKYNFFNIVSLVRISAKILHCRYWKLSLLVHPDKCTHPRAHEAFTALNKAFKDLQDPIKVS